MKDLSQAPGDLEKFLTGVVRETLVSFSSDLSTSDVSPWDTGRFASSWFPDYKGSGDSLVVTYKKAYKLSNPLPYAERLCFGDWAVSQPKNWFPAYFNSRGQSIVNQAVRKAEQEL